MSLPANYPVRIIIMAKAPRPGFAKTRLIPVLGAEGAAALAAQLLSHTLDMAIAANVGEIELCVTPDIHDVAWQGIAIPDAVFVSCQCEDDLGARMANVCRPYLERGQSILLMGTDCVEMSLGLLEEATIILGKNTNIIYPTMDGGYALLGLTLFDESLFADMPWSTDQVARISIDRLMQLSKPLFIGQTLHDIDTPGDLEFMENGMLLQRPAIMLESTITCPHCHVAQREVMPKNACQFYYECHHCHQVLRPLTGDCCVFCSYGTVKCPPVQSHQSCL